MSSKRKLKRKSFFVDERALRRATKVLGASSEGEAVRVSVERALEMEEFWNFMRRTRNILEPKSIETV